MRCWLLLTSEALLVQRAELLTGVGRQGERAARYAHIDATGGVAVAVDVPHASLQPEAALTG